MVYLIITAGIILLDSGIKHHIDRKYARRVEHPLKAGTIEKYYNNGAALDFLEQRPALVCVLHAGMLSVTGLCYCRLLREPGRALCKTGLAMLVGGGAGNLYDRLRKGHVVDYFRINAGPKRFRRIMFNLSDFCIFTGALLVVAGAGTE